MASMNMPRQVPGEITGDTCDALLTFASRQVEAHPGSVYFFALRTALQDLSSRFGDDQGVELERFQRINRLIREPLSRLLEAGALDSESPQGETALSEFLRALHTL